MRNASISLATVTLLVLFTACAEYDAEHDGGTVVLNTLPVTTESDEARGHFNAGLAAQDMGQGNDANAHFEMAVKADPTFATGYLFVANTATSTEEFTANLKKAGELAANVSRPEQILIEMTQKGFDRDFEGQLALGQELTEQQPESPRAWLALAGVQSGLQDIDDSRASIERALEIAPDFAPAHMQLGNNYLFLDPKDFDKAERHFKAAVDLAPNEPTPYDLLGDVHRAQGNLEAAYQDYTKAAEHAPDQGSPLQQRGHVNSFLGKYDEARADYDRSMELETARGNNNAPFFAVFRAYVSIHAGDSDAAIAELSDLVANADQMTVEGKTDVKINGLTNIAQIAMHYGDFAKAEEALVNRARLMRGQANDVGTDEFRRAQEAGIVYFDAMLAARRGTADAARAKAKEYEALVEPDPNPRKMEAVHQVLGITEFFQKDYAAAVEHLEQANPNNIYMKYYRALALAELGRSEEAGAILDKIAVWNFNGVGYAMIRKDVLDRVSG